MALPSETQAQELRTLPPWAGRCGCRASAHSWGPIVKHRKEGVASGDGWPGLGWGPSAPWQFGEGVSAPKRFLESAPRGQTRGQQRRKRGAKTPAPPLALRAVVFNPLRSLQNACVCLGSRRGPCLALLVLVLVNTSTRGGILKGRNE